jgi:Carboxypeptidase regulatory-like domain
MRGIATILILFGFAGAGSLFAQHPPDTPNKQQPPFFGGSKKDKDNDDKARSVEGVVKDGKDEPLEGAVVQLKDTKTLQVRSFITKEDGAYRFHGLNTNVDYQVKAERQGAVSGPKTVSVFDSRKQIVINFKLEPKK